MQVCAGCLFLALYEKMGDNKRKEEKKGECVMGMKDILDRIRKLEASRNTPERVTLIYLIAGEEKRRSMDMHEATRQVMEQAAALLFGGEQGNRIIGVEGEEGDGFLESLIETEPIENIEDIVEV